MTKTHFIIETHTDTTPCADLKNCTKRSHWTQRDEEHRTIALAREATEGDDSPAFRIVKETVRVEREMAEGPWLSTLPVWEDDEN
jgi:hypothetical protein